MRKRWWLGRGGNETRCTYSLFSKCSKAFSMAVGNPWRYGLFTSIRISILKEIKVGGCDLPFRCSCNTCYIFTQSQGGAQHHGGCSQSCLQRRMIDHRRHGRPAHLGSCARYGQSYHSGSTWQNSSCPPIHRHRQKSRRCSRETDGTNGCVNLEEWVEKSQEVTHDRCCLPDCTCSKTLPWRHPCNASTEELSVARLDNSRYEILTTWPSPPP